ncbi:alpha-(1,3)-fucosyltransferase C [Spodoptera frugiperda]|uniref:Fucosyltransferase n=1 Tax=Spodoptera frugiperda TaxID=7108 RepID=A0A9R0D786_SPOFR|nr:alpha-(1,3)-fucosyltransferase C [Spodoptera frugiperda]
MRDKKDKSMYTYHIKDMVFVSNCKKNFLKITVCCVFGIVGLIVMILPHVLMSSHVVHHRRSTRYPTDLKYILFWSHKKHKNLIPTLSRLTEFQPGQKTFIDQKCRHINCYITYNKKTLTNDEDFDAVVFDLNTVAKMDVNLLNLTRSPEQLYIFRSSETSDKYPLCDHDLEHFFNWTWTYKLSSDIPQPFLTIYNTMNHSIVGPTINTPWVTIVKKTRKYANKIRQKNKAVAWILTKCRLKSKHEDYIREFRYELSRYNYTLDIYGPCSANKCPGGSALKCYKMLEKDYFFQIVVEEYLTEDYVTEVMVSAMSHLAIPIVLGPNDYSNFLPPGSYINAQTFSMPKLVALVDYLIRNPDMYEYFLDWKKYYYYKVRPRSYVCDLCQKLNEFNGTSVTVRHFRHWWDPDYKDECQRLRLFKLFNTET